MLEARSSVEAPSFSGPWPLGPTCATFLGAERLLQRAQPGHFVESPFFSCAGLEARRA